MEKIIKKCIKNGYTYKIQPLTYGYDRIEITYNNMHEMNVIINSFKRMNVKVEFHHHCNCISVYNYIDYEEWKAKNKAMTALTNVFNLARHEGKNIPEALEIQRIYAENNDLMELFNILYA